MICIVCGRDSVPRSAPTCGFADNFSRLGADLLEQPKPRTEHLEAVRMAIGLLRNWHGLEAVSVAMVVELRCWCGVT